MKAGKVLKDMRGRKGLSQENLANDLYISQQLVSKLEGNERDLTKDLAKSSVTYYDDAEYGFHVARETAEDYITPLTNSGKAIEWHRLALEEVFKQEAVEAIDRFNEVSLIKPPQHADESELKQIEDSAKELLDVQASINSFLTCLEQEYSISIKACMKNRIPTWKARGWIK
ncbi:helix-turn-helix transcriptional regulator [Virgibacillus litoralis]|uniref:Transcriptional regulator with XRE-family HTH domain n=1 Tax=Virgibacillus litoralis TaxID=578221 RepID=A0ABS4HH58_9BACI|nr:helix-turn-helix transcriptional regulator [Virgibacillus litoralis]MBP1950251.1 transcriptional regulator with XRE-family HTH domain [Virgibacillus litoralis]